MTSRILFGVLSSLAISYQRLRRFLRTVPVVGNAYKLIKRGMTAEPAQERSASGSPSTASTDDLLITAAHCIKSGTSVSDYVQVAVAHGANSGAAGERPSPVTAMPRNRPARTCGKPGAML